MLAEWVTLQTSQKALYNELKLGKCRKGAQWKHFKDTLKQNLSSCGLNIDNFQDTGKDRPEWRTTSNKHIEKDS